MQVTAVGTVRRRGLYHLHANVGTAIISVNGFAVSELVDLGDEAGNIWSQHEGEQHLVSN